MRKDGYSGSNRIAQWNRWNHSYKGTLIMRKILAVFLLLGACTSTPEMVTSPLQVYWNNVDSTYQARTISIIIAPNLHPNSEQVYHIRIVGKFFSYKGNLVVCANYQYPKGISRNEQFKIEAWFNHAKVYSDETPIGYAYFMNDYDPDLASLETASCSLTTIPATDALMNGTFQVMK
jgi:hypothetical protein